MIDCRTLPEGRFNVVASLRLLMILILFSVASQPVAYAMPAEKYSTLAHYLKQTLDKDSVPDSVLDADLKKAIAASNPDPKKVFMAIRTYTRELRIAGRQGDCAQFLYPVISILENEKSPNDLDKENLLNLYAILGASLEEIGMQNTAMDLYMKGLYSSQFASDPKFDLFRAMLLNNLGVIYYRAGLYDKARKYFDSALKLNLSLDNKIEISTNYNNLAAVCEELDSLDRAIDYTLTSVRFIDQKSNPIDFYLAYINLGMQYCGQGNSELGLSYLRTALSRLTAHNYVQGIVGAASGLAVAYLDINRLDSAYKYAKMAFDISDRGNLYNLEIDGLKLLAKVAARQGDNATAYAFASRASALGDSVMTLDRRQHLEDWERVHKAQHDLLNEPVPMSASTAFTISGIIFVALSLVVFLTIRHRYRISKTRVALKLRQKTEETAELRRQLDLRNRHLTARSISDMKMQGGLELLSEEVRNFIRQSAPKSKEDRNALQNLLKMIDKLGSDGNDALKEFHLYFEQVHSEFYEFLTTKCPDLTDKEERLCAFLYLGLSTKEIADITYREVRSVESSRNRLRKKLGLDPDVSIRDYLRSRTVTD